MDVFTLSVKGKNYSDSKDKACKDKAQITLLKTSQGEIT